MHWFKSCHVTFTKTHLCPAGHTKLTSALINIHDGSRCRRCCWWRNGLIVIVTSCRWAQTHTHTHTPRERQILWTHNLRRSLGGHNKVRLCLFAMRYNKTNSNWRHRSSAKSVSKCYPRFQPRVTFPNFVEKNFTNDLSASHCLHITSILF